MSQMATIAQEAREAALKLVGQETWSLTKENAFLNGVVETYQAMEHPQGAELDEIVLRALTVYLQKTTARKRTLVMLLDRARQRARLFIDEAALAAIVANIKTRIADTRTDPASLGDRLRRMMARI